MKKSKKLFPFAALLLLLTTQCRKENGEYTLNGKVLNGRTGAAMSNAAVNLQKKVVSGGTYNAAYSAAASATADANGLYTMTWERENFAALKVSASLPQFIAKEIELNVSSFTVDSPQTQNIELYPEAYVEVSIINTLPTQSSDLLSFTFLNAQFDCFCCTNGFTSYQGAADTNYSCKLYGDQWLKYQCNFNIGASDSVVVDSVWCPSFQTTPLHIQY